jgi:hypothetical protein
MFGRMSALSDTLTVGLVLVLLFGSIALYLYTRIQQAEQKINLLENILLDLKMSSEVRDYTELPAHQMEEHSTMTHDSPHSPHSPPTTYSTYDENDSDDEVSSPVRPVSPASSVSSKRSVTEQHSGEDENDKDNEIEFYKSVIDSAVTEKVSQEEQSDSTEQKVNVNYESMTIKELQALAKQRGISGATTMKKNSIIEALKTSDRVMSSAPNKTVEPGSLSGIGSFLETSATIEDGELQIDA